jgi:uncharacterized membrane protein YkoI
MKKFAYFQSAEWARAHVGKKQNRRGGSKMKYLILQSGLVAAMIIWLTGLGFAENSQKNLKKESGVQTMSLSDLPAPVRATVERLINGGKIKKLEKEEENGKVVYDIEAKVKGKDVEYDIASDGSVLTAEESVPYNSLPVAVKAAVEKFFGSSKGLKASREVENGKTFYEVEGKKGSATKALKLTEAGLIVEE